MDPTPDPINKPRPPIPPVPPPHGGDPENDHDADDTLQSPPPHHVGPPAHVPPDEARAHIVYKGPAGPGPEERPLPDPAHGHPPHWVGPPAHVPPDEVHAHTIHGGPADPGQISSRFPPGGGDPYGPPTIEPHEKGGTPGPIPPEPIPPHEMPSEKIPGVSFNPNNVPTGGPILGGAPAMPGTNPSGTTPSSSITDSSFDSKDVSAKPISAGASGVNLGGESIAITNVGTQGASSTLKPMPPVPDVSGGVTSPLEQKPDLLKPWNTHELTDDAMGLNLNPPGKPKI